MFIQWHGYRARSVRSTGLHRVVYSLDSALQQHNLARAPVPHASAPAAHIIELATVSMTNPIAANMAL